MHSDKSIQLKVKRKSIDGRISRFQLSPFNFQLFQRGQRGMSLLEAVVWVGVFVFAMLALTQSVLSFYRTNRYAIQEASAINSAQHAMDTVVRVARTASYSNTGAYPIISIAPNQISFYANVKKNDPLTQQVRFFLQGTSLMQGVVQPSGSPMTYASTSEIVTTLGDYVQNGNYATSTFYYFDKNGNSITDFTKFSDVRFLTISLIVDVSTTSNPTQLKLISSAALRNLVGK